MNAATVPGNEPMPNPMNQEQDMAAFLDNMLLSTPMVSSENAEESENDDVKGHDSEKETDIDNSHVDNAGSSPTQIAYFHQFCLIFGLVSDHNDPSKYHDAVMMDVFEKVRSSIALFAEFHGLLFAVATVGNLTEARAPQIPPPMMAQIRSAMKNFGVRFAEHGRKSDPDKVDLAGFAMYFPGDMFTILRRLRTASCLQSFLPPDVSTHVPRELTFLGVGALSCLLSKEADKKKLQQVVKYIGDQFCAQLVRASGQNEEHIRRSVLRTQALCTPPMEFLIKGILKEGDIVDALSRVNIPGQSDVSSKKRINGKRMVKGKASKP